MDQVMQHATEGFFSWGI